MKVTMRAVLFDRDGTLIGNVPYNGDPDLVEPIPGALECLTGLRAAGLKVGVVTNQSAVGRGMIDIEDVERVNLRVERLLGAFDVWKICPHAPWESCLCRKPSPDLILQAARALRVAPEQCWVVGDSARDVDAALAAGARPLRYGPLTMNQIRDEILAADGASVRQVDPAGART